MEVIHPNDDLPLPDEFPPPHSEDGGEPDGEAGVDTSPNAEVNSDSQSPTLSPNLLKMLKAAESRWTPQSGEGAGGEASDTAAGEPAPEAPKTDLVRFF